ncbi:MAG: CBS domain-containing protein [Gammaproteobacteria bacterium]
MHKKPTLAATMTPFPYAVDVEAPVADAETLMKQHDIHHLPVTREGQIAGIVSARDVADRDTRGWLVRDVFQPEPYVVDLATPLEEVLGTMIAKRIGSAIVTRHDRLAGIFTHVDVCRSYLSLLREVFPAPPADVVA